MFILLLIIFIDQLGFGMIFPLLPLIKLKFGLSLLELGCLVSSYSLFNLIGILFFGVLSDKIGRKYILSIPLIFAALVYYLTPYAQTYTDLLILRSLSGFFTSNFAVAFACASDFSSKENKFKNMSYLGSAFGLGVILGPVLGGLLAGNTNDIEIANFTAPFIASAAMALASGLIALFFLRESLDKIIRNAATKTSILKNLKNLLSNRVVVIFTYLNILLALILSGLEAYLSLWLNQKFLFTSQNLGIYWGIFSLIITIGQLLAFKLFKSPINALVCGFTVLGLTIAGLVLAYNTIVLWIITIIMAFAMGLIFPNIYGSLAMEGSPNQQGLIFGISQAIGSIGRIIGPYLVGLLYIINPNLSWLFIAVVCISSIPIIYKGLEK